MARSTFCLLAATLLLFSGCQKAPPAIVPVEGVVLLGGQPLPHAQVSFVPMVSNLGFEYVAVGTTDENGRFQLTCKGKPGACACDHRVTVTDASPPENARGMSGEAQAEMAKFYAGLKNRPIPERYANTAKTPLSVTVTAGQAEYKLELKR
jgi:hypothetical protein